MNKKLVAVEVAMVIVAVVAIATMFIDNSTVKTLVLAGGEVTLSVARDVLKGEKE